MEEIGPYGLYKSNPNVWIHFDYLNGWMWPNANWLLMEFVHVDECHFHLFVNSIMSFTFIHVVHMCLFLYLHITISSLRFIFIHVVTFHAHGYICLVDFTQIFYMSLSFICMVNMRVSFMTEHNSMITSAVLLCWQFHLVLSLIQEDS
jgi:hypothetical protein